MIKNVFSNVSDALATAQAKVAVGCTLALIAAGPVFAQVSGDPFDAAMTASTTATSKYAAALVGLAAVAVVFMIAIKYVKKISRAA